MDRRNWLASIVAGIAGLWGYKAKSAFVSDGPYPMPNYPELTKPTHCDKPATSLADWHVLHIRYAGIESQVNGTITHSDRLSDEDYAAVKEHFHNWI